MSQIASSAALQPALRPLSRTAPERSRAVAVWLFAVAVMVVAMVVVGGATRLTGSGLSITEWKPLKGALPPLSQADWLAEFRNYQRIPQYQFVNRGMSLDAFKPLFWWEWAHRLLGRTVGLVFFGPLIAFVALRRMPRRLLWPCVVILALGGLQGAIGWWMVSSGVFTAERTAVAPERLAVHLGLALALFCACIWTGLEAWSGPGRPGGEAVVWRRVAAALGGLVFMQSILGALVAGNKAGLIYNDWPLMGGRLIPSDYAGARPGLWATLAHSQAAVQFNHRIGAYLLFAGAIAFAVAAARSSRLSRGVKTLALALAGGVTLQALLGVSTLMSGATLSLSLLHQLGAVTVLAIATALAWRSQRQAFQVS